MNQTLDIYYAIYDSNANVGIIFYRGPFKGAAGQFLVKMSYFFKGEKLSLGSG